MAPVFLVGVFFVIDGGLEYQVKDNVAVSEFTHYVLKETQIYDFEGNALLNSQLDEGTCVYRPSASIAVNGRVRVARYVDDEQSADGNIFLSEASITPLAEKHCRRLHGYQFGVSR